MVFQLARTYQDPAAGSGPQRGFPAPGDGAQTSGPAPLAQDHVFWEPERPTKGTRSWFKPAAGGQQGFPTVGELAQGRAPGSRPNVPPVYGLNMPVYTPYFSRGAAAYVQNYGKVLTNPIGAGVVAQYRPQASYGPAAQYENGALWWTSQVIPTSINPQGLTSPDELAALLDGLQVQAVVRTTG